MSFYKITSLLLAGALALTNAEVEEKYFEQKLDHKNPDDATRWRQRYLENRDYAKDGSPVFIAFGGPPYVPVIPLLLQKGSMVEYAKNLGAGLILLETRYYGKSRPTSDLQLSNLEKFHSPEQSIIDKVEFIKWLKTQPEYKDSKIVAFGIGFTGQRLLNVMKNYPDLVQVGVLSSTPVEAKFEVPEYVGTAAEIMRRDNPECAKTLHDAIICLDKIAKGETCEGHNLADLKETFNLCDDLDPTHALDSAMIRGEILKYVGSVILLDNPDPNFIYNVHKMCSALGDESKGLSHMDKLAGEVKKILAFRNKTCLEFRFDEVEKRLSNTEWDTPGTISGERQAMFLRCTSAVNIRTSDALDVGQEINTNTTLEFCQRVFNVSPGQVRLNTETNNEKFGARKLPQKCAVFATGGNDLLKSISVTKQEEAGNCNKVFYIEGSSFARDRWSIAADDSSSYPAGLRDAQLKIGQTIEQWLRTGDCCMS